jgi:GT2 family glycosyltransferase
MGGTMECYPAGIHRTGIRGKHYLKNCDYPWLPFCVVAFNPETVTEIGLLDGMLKMWFSDSDYSIRVRATGKSVTLVADAFVRHEQSAAVNATRSDKLDRQFIMDRAYFEHKYGGQILEECK